MRNIPTPFHQSSLWTAITALSITITGAIVIGLIYLTTQIISFLQPLLIPFAIAAVMAYLLDPVVSKLVQWGIKRQRAVWLVFLVVTAALIGIAFIIIPTLVKQGADFATEVPGYVSTAEKKVTIFVKEWHDKLKKEYNIELLDFILDTQPKEPMGPPLTVPPVVPPVSVPALVVPTVTTTTDPKTVAPATTTGAEAVGPLQTRANFDINDLLSGSWLKDAVTQVVPTTWEFVKKSVGGFLGVFGFLLSMIIVPLYLYYFLTESAVIAKRWSEFVPLRASQFKDEVVGTITEINGYLMAFFRGQLLVSLINGLATGLGLVAVGLKFGWLIGLSLCLLGMVPYLGIVVCWVPAVIIASVQGGDGTWITNDPWWVFPLVVTGIFAAVQQVDGLFVTPKIVGESVGLHPMTVIMSVFLWSLVMGGLLGAILAVPMTASVKVLFQRYVWHRHLQQVEDVLIV